MTHPEHTTKHCHVCNATKPLADFGINRALTDGRQNVCRPCINARRRSYYAANPERGRAYATRYRAENPEKVIKSRKAHYRRNAAFYRQRARDDYRSNTDWHKERHRAWLQRRRDHVMAYQRAYNESHRVIKNERTRIRRAAMPPEQRYRWQRAHPDRCADARARNRARRQQCPRIDRIDRPAIIRRDASTCYLCGRVLNRSEITLDHVVPLARGGTHTDDNLRVCCTACNSRKGTRLLSELAAV